MKKTTKCSFMAYCLWALCLASSATAQPISMRFDKLTPQDGLSRANVKSFAQDQKGFIWVGTGYGLNRYDGYSFTTYLHNPSDSNSLSSNEVRSLLVGQQGDVWIGLRSGGLNRYDYASDTFEHIGEELLGQSEIDHLMQDSLGNIWVSSTNGIARYNPQTKEFLHIPPKPTHPQSLPNRYVKHIYQDRQGNYWVSHDSGLSQMHLAGKDSVYFDNIEYIPKKPGGLPTSYVKQVIEDRDGNLWVATDGGMAIFDREKRTFQVFQHIEGDPCSLSNNYVKAVALDDQGQLWVGADAGISVFNPSTHCFQQYSSNPNNANSLSNNYVKAIFRTNDGSMWVGTDAGINRYNAYQYPFKTLQSSQAKGKGLSSSCVYDIEEASGNWVWIATSRGINKLNTATGETKLYPNTPSGNRALPSPSVKALLKDRQGNLWAGTDNGLSRLVKETENSLFFKTYQHDPDNPHSLSNNSVVSLAEDEAGHIWAGTWGGGLSRYDSEKDRFDQMTKDRSLNGILLSSNQVQHIMIDDYNTLWVGNAELDTIDLDHWKSGQFRKDSKMETWVKRSNHAITYQGENSRIWIGTTEGMLEYDRRSGKLKHYGKKDGLKSEIIQSIIEDEDGYIWIGTDKGLIRLSAIKRKPQHFDASDGLQPSEFNIMSAFKAESGKLFIGGLKGLNIFDPTELMLNQEEPPVYITGLHIQNKPITPHNSEILDQVISETESIVLPHDNTFIKLEFVAINYRNPHKNQYAYRLKGLQDEWIYTSAKRRDANFSSLPPGKYEFQVKASNNNGVWNEKGASLKITVTPPWWETTWFRVIGSAVLIVAVYLFIRVRTKILEDQKMALSQKVEERTAALSKANTSLKEQQQEVLTQNEELQQQAEEIAAQRDRIEQQHKALVSAYQDMKVVSEMGKDITSSFSINHIFEEVYKDINLIMDAPTFGIGIYSKSKKALQFMQIDGKGQEITYSSDKIENDTLLSVQCFKQGEIKSIKHFSKEMSDYPVEGDSEINESIIYLPLRSKDGLSGVLTVQSRIEDAYSSQHITLLEILASYAATALDNSKAYEIIHSKNELITDSIRYAQTIQQAILPAPEKLAQSFKDHFVLFRPKDIVSGDFYWYMSVIDQGVEKRYIACVDCTGHGVPGAFMSMIASRILAEVLVEKGLRSPAAILELLDQSIRVALKQGDGSRSSMDPNANTDGMDLSLCCLRPAEDGTTEVTFAGAKGDLYYTQNNTVLRLGGNKRSIGGLQLSKAPFDEATLVIPKGSSIYLCSDGLADQHGPDRKKYGKARLMQQFQDIHAQDMSTQKRILEESLEQHQQSMEQRDDITVIGIRV